MGGEEEELEHILIHCPSIWGHWTDLLFAFGESWACLFLVKDLLQSWLHFPVRKNAKSIWRAAPLILFWVIWKERNRVIFEDTTFSTLRLKLFLLSVPFLLGLVVFQRQISPFLVGLLGFVYSMYTPFLVNILFFYRSKKKKKNRGKPTN